jgi:uncharacterized protein YndB with AHSA1/START domain
MAALVPAFALSVLLLAGAATAATPPAFPVAKAYPGVTDTSFTADNGDRVMRLSIEVAADPAQIWHVFSTADGWRALGVKTAYVNFRQGGVVETSYKAGVPQGDPDNIKNQIVAFAPNQLLVFRNVQAPRDFPGAALFARVTTIVLIEPLGPGRTRVTLSGDGYGAGPGFDDLYAKFLGGNAYTLAGLKDALDKAPDPHP